MVTDSVHPDRPSDSVVSAACDQRTYAINDTDHMTCLAPASVEVFDIDGAWHPRCQPHVPIFAREQDARERVRSLR